MMLASPQIDTTRPELSQETRKAIEAGIDLLRAEGYQVSFPESLSSIVWRLLVEATDTLRRLPDREKGWLMAGDRIAWPEVIHSAQEHYEAELQRLVDLKMSKELAPLPRLAVADPAAIPRMLTVLSWLRYYTARKTSMSRISKLQQEKRAMLEWALGAPTKRVRYLLGGGSRNKPYMVRQRFLEHICRGVEHACGIERIVRRCANHPICSENCQRLRLARRTLARC